MRERERECVYMFFMGDGFVLGGLKDMSAGFSVVGFEFELGFGLDFGFGLGLEIGF